MCLKLKQQRVKISSQPMTVSAVQGKQQMWAMFESTTGTYIETRHLLFIR